MSAKANNDPKTLKRIISSFSFLAALALIVYLAASIGLSLRARSSGTLSRVWQADIEQLKSQNSLPEFWNEIRQVEKLAAQGDTTAMLWVKSVSAPVTIDTKGEFKLEILFLSQKTDSGNLRAVIQHHMIHIPTGNSVWEMSRTYEL